jgi:hypothetical protein
MKRLIPCRAGVIALVLVAGSFASAPKTYARDSQTECSNRDPRVTTLFPAGEMPHTERVVAVGHRLFVTSDGNLFEVLDGPRGKLRKVSIAAASVALGDGSVPGVFLALAGQGRTLYATATAFTDTSIPYASMLYRIELGPRPGEVATVESAPFVGHATPFLPNGMAVDRGGDLFISNSFSAATGEAAIAKIKVHAQPFSFGESNWLLAEQGGAFPNGIQLDGNTLYLASLSVIYRVAIERDGNAGQVSVLYAANPDDFLDDFAVMGGELVVCEIDNPFAPPAASTSQLTVVAKTGPNAGAVTRVIPLAATGIHPSSVVKESAGHGELLVTDYSAGGLFSISF